MSGHETKLSFKTLKITLTILRFVIRLELEYVHNANEEINTLFK